MRKLLIQPPEQMALLFEHDYEILKSAGLDFEEDNTNRFLVLKNFPLKKGMYKSGEIDLEEVEVLVVIPPNYNSIGNDMLWIYPELKRTDGVSIPAALPPGKNSKTYDNKVYCRWSRHYVANSWNSKVDNIQKILDRIEWALTNPSTNK